VARLPTRKPGVDPNAPPPGQPGTLGFDLRTAPGGVSFAHRNIPPPAPLYITLDDSFYCEIHNISPATACSVILRVLEPSGKIKTYLQTIVLNGSGLFTSTIFGTSEGFLLGAAVGPGGLNVHRGQCWMRLAILRGGAAGPGAAQILIQDYVETHYAATWPFGTIRSELEGRGNLRSIVGTDPAAGVEISETVPTGRRWRVQSVNFGLTTSAVVANRQVLFIIDDGVNSGFLVPAVSVQAASLLVGYCWTPGAASISTTGGRSIGPLPSPCIMTAGMRFRTVTTNLDPGANYGPPVYVVEELLEVIT